MGIKHTVPAGLPTGTVTGKVAGDDWRADHVCMPFPVTMLHMGTANYTLSPLTAGTVEPSSPASRMLMDLSTATQFRLAVGQRVIGVGATSCDLRLQYASNGATQSTWVDANATGTGVSLMGGTVPNIREGGWVNLNAAAIADSMYLRAAIVTVGTLTTAPQFSFVDVLFR